MRSPSSPQEHLLHENHFNAVEDHEKSFELAVQPNESVQETGLQSGARHGTKPLSKAMGFMLLAQLFNSLMNVFVRVLERPPVDLHPLQLLVIRMTFTSLSLTGYIYHRSHSLSSMLGLPGNRGLLLIRAFGGFVGVVGLYSSLRNLNVTEATVITFLTPFVTNIMSYFILKTPFERHDVALSAAALLGVVLVASSRGVSQSTPDHGAISDQGSALERIGSLLEGLLGVVGSSAAMLSIQAMGKTEDSFIVINWYATLTCFVSAIGLPLVTSEGFKSPGGIWDWGVLLFSALSGLLFQIFLTMALQTAQSQAVVNMVYMQLVFALILDYVVLEAIPGGISIVGAAFITSAASAIAFRSSRRKPQHSSSDGP